MNVLIVLGHPDESSFNHAIAETCRQKLAENGHSVIFHDLYKEKFDPIICSPEIPKTGKYNEIIKKHCDELMAADGIIVVHPNWWGQPPAILKGWVDRVIRPGIAYEFADGDSGEGVPIGLLKANTALVFNTSNTSEKREIEVFKDPLEAIWKNCIFDLCGVEKFDRRMFRIIITSSLEERQAWLDEVKVMINRYFPRV
jgi:putative NADPH-quinone reductase